MPARTQACAIARLTGTPGGGLVLGPRGWALSRQSVVEVGHEIHPRDTVGRLGGPFAIWSGVSRKYAPPPADGLQYLAIAAQVMTPSMPQVPMMAPLLV